MGLKQLREKITNWELWPFGFRYLPIIPVWLWYCMRSRSLWFFTASNPTLTFGGFEGEGKKEMYEQLPPGSYPCTIFIQPGIAFEKVLQQIKEAGFTFPFIVKPDVGMEGILFKIIRSEQQLQQYHSNMPAEYLVQELVTYPGEYSIFYYRHPANTKGTITGFLKKTPMEVVGDGKSTLIQLIIQHPKARYRLKEMQLRHSNFLNTIVGTGEQYFLSYAANLNRGASFESLPHEIDSQLLELFDTLNLYSKNFFYGRYDLKANSVADLKNGKNFSILEFNGSGAEPNHIYHSGFTLRQAHKEILKHWKALYEISRYNHKLGIPYWPFRKGWQFLKASRTHFATLRKIDIQTPS